MKKMTKWMLTSAVVLSMGMAVMAEEAVTEDGSGAVVIVTEEAEETHPGRIADTAYIFDSPLGLWDNAGYVGDYDFEIASDLYVYPDCYIQFSEIVLPFTIVDETHYTAEYDDGIWIEAEYGQLTEEEIEEYDVTEYSFYYAQVGDPRLLVTVHYPDYSNPLVPTEESTTTLMVKYSDQSGYFENLLTGKCWSIGENLLEIDTEGEMSLNGGLSTGSIYFTRDSEKRVKIQLSWDNGKYFNYYPTGLSEDSVELTNVDKPEEVLLLVFEEELDEVEEYTEDYEEYLEDAVEEAVSEAEGVMEEIEAAVEEFLEEASEAE